MKSRSSPIIYLYGGEDIRKRTNFKQNAKICSTIRNPRVLILAWTSKNEKKESEYREILVDYFKDLGVEYISFLERSDPKRIALEKMKNSNILYIPGGDTEILLKRAKRRKWLIEAIKKYKRIIMGNSAGAIFLCRKGIGKKGEKYVIYEGIGMVNIIIRVHYKKADDKFLRKINELVVCLKEGDILMVKDNQLVFLR